MLLLFTCIVLLGGCATFGMDQSQRGLGYAVLHGRLFIQSPDQGASSDDAQPNG
jgi:hypothetical protein